MRKKTMPLRLSRSFIDSRSELMQIPLQEGTLAAMKRKALIVEDEVKIAKIVKTYLERENFDVFLSHDGLDAVEKVETSHWDIVILDLMLPGLDGETVCKKIKNKKDTPVIMLTARTSERDKLRGFDLGADDYISKPFSPRELVARVKAVLKRVPDTSTNDIVLGNGMVKIDIEKMEVYQYDRKIELTPVEFTLLLFMATSPGVVFTREKLIQKAFGNDYEGYDRTIDVHIKNLRKKIEEKPDTPLLIKTVYSVGYKLENPGGS
jgi:DNA-binding response OmpR family regulator